MEKCIAKYEEFKEDIQNAKRGYFPFQLLFK
jgi:hypothetical protein